MKRRRLRMFIIQGVLTCQSKLPMNYKHFSQVERYNINALMKAGHDQTQIAKLLDQNKSTISTEISRNRGLKGYRPKQACELTAKQSEQSRNAKTVPAWVCEQAANLMCLQWSPMQIAGKLQLSHEMLYQHVYADKARGGKLWKNLRYQKQKIMRYVSVRDRRGQIPHRRPLSDRPSHIEARKEVGHWKCDTVIGANHKGAIVTMVKRKTGLRVIVKVAYKTSELLSKAIVEGLNPFADRVKTLTYDKCIDSATHIQIEQALKSTGNFARPF